MSGRRIHRYSHGFTKQEQAEMKAFENSKAEIAGKRRLVTCVLPARTCNAHPFLHYHPTMKWSREEESED